MTYLSEVTADTPFKYLRLEETSGAFVDSGSNSAQGASTTGAAITAGQRGVPGIPAGGLAVSFTGGTTSYISIPTSNTFATDNRFSAEALVKTSQATGVDRPVVAYGVGGRGFRMGVDTAGKPYIESTNANGTIRATHTKVVNDGLWHHIVGVVDLTNGTTIYVDGVAVANAAAVSGSQSATADFTYIGGVQNSSGFIGTIDEVAVYDQALTATRVNAHYLASGLVATNAGYVAQAAAASALMPNGVASATKTINYAISASTATASLVNPGVSVAVGVNVSAAASAAGAFMPQGTKTLNNVRYYSPAAETITRPTGQAPNYIYVDTYDLSDISFNVSSAILQLTAASGYEVDYQNNDGTWTAIATVGQPITNGGEQKLQPLDITDVVADWVNGSLVNHNLRLIGATPLNGNVITTVLGNSLPTTNRTVPAGVATATATLVNAVPSVTFNPHITVTVNGLVGEAFADAGRDNGFSTPTEMKADAMTAQAESLNAMVFSARNAAVKASLLGSARANIVPPVEAQNEIFDPYYIRVKAHIDNHVDYRIPTAAGTPFWFRLDEIAGPVAFEKSAGRNGSFGPGVKFGGFGPQNRRTVTFDGTANSYVQLYDNDWLADSEFGGTAEITLRTTQQEADIVTGSDTILRGNGIPPQYQNLISLRGGKVFSNGFVGRTNVADGEWHHIVMTLGGNMGDFTYTPYGLTVYVDGKLEFHRSIFPYIIPPDTIGSFNGEVMEFVWEPVGIPASEVAARYFDVFGIIPVAAGPASANAEITQGSKAKGNGKRALGLYYNGNVASESPFLFAGTPFKKPAPNGFAFGGGVTTAAWRDYDFTFYFKSIVGKEGFEHSTDYLGGRYYDDVTGESKFIDFENDIDLSGFDMVFFIDTPPTGTGTPDGFSESFSTLSEEMYASLLRAQRKHGFSLWVPQPDVAVGLGIIDKWESHTMDREFTMTNADQRSADLMDAFSANSFGRQWYDTHCINKGRIVATEQGLTDLPAWIMKDYAFGYSNGGNDFKPPFMAWDLENRPNGLLIGDEVFYGQNFFGDSGAAIVNQRNLVVSIPDGHVKAGTVLMRENAIEYKGRTPVANPWKDNAVSIILKPGDPINGQPVGGKIYVDFMTAPDQFAEPNVMQIVPPNEQIAKVDDWENAEMRKWDYSSSRTTTSQTAVGGSTTVQQTGTQATDLMNLLGKLTTHNDVFYTADISEKYPTQTVSTLSMWQRAFKWMTDRPEQSEGGVVIHVAAVTADAGMVDPVVKAQKDAAIRVAPAIALAEIRKPANVLDPSTVIRTLPMEAFAKMTGYGKTIAVGAMTASATIVENFDMVHARGENVVLTLNYVDAIVYLKEDS